MFQQFTSPDTTTYSLQLRNDTASVECIIGWDMDGNKDDKCFGKQVKVQ